MPLLLGIAAGGARPGHALLAVAAVSAYLYSVPAIDWLRTRRPELRPPMIVFGVVLAASGGALLLAYPALLPLVGAAVVAALATIALAVGGRANSVLVSLVQVAQALLLVPAAATVAGTAGDPSTARAALAAGLYLVGTVLVVRSLIRARGNALVVGASVVFHVAAVVAAALLLPVPFAVLAAALLARAVALPVLQRRLAAGPRKLRPIHIGLVEIAASVVLIVLAFTVGFGG